MTGYVSEDIKNIKYKPIEKQRLIETLMININIKYIS